MRRQPKEDGLSGFFLFSCTCLSGDGYEDVCVSDQDMIR